MINLEGISSAIRTVQGDSSVLVTRFLESEVVDGYVQDPKPATPFPIDASFQPISQKDLQLLPEGMRNEGTVKIYTETELFTSDSSECGIPDRLCHEDIVYQVQSVDSWKDIGNFFKVVAVRVDQ